MEAIAVAQRIIEEQEPLQTFFHAELANERHGGASPSTLRTAMDSLVQAPEGIFFQDAEEAVDSYKTLLSVILLVGDLDYEIEDLV